MATQVQNRRGSTAEHSTFTGAVGELTVDTDKDTAVVHDGSTAGGAPLLREDGSNSALALGSAASPSLKFTGDTNTGIYSPGADQLAISTNGTGRLFISDTKVQVSNPGNTAEFDVGIGATGDNFAAINLIGDTTYPIFGLRLIRTNTGANADSQINHRGTGPLALNAVDAGNIQFKTNNTERLRITSDGKLGLGTSTPGAVLESKTANVQAGDAAYAKKAVITNIPYSTSNVTSSAIAVYDGTIHATDIGYSYDGSGYYLAFGTNQSTTGTPTERLRIDRLGRVGIGTTLPSAALDVLPPASTVCLRARSNSASDPVTALQVTPSNLSAEWFGVVSGPTQTTVNASTGNLVISTSGSERARIDSSGRLLVGTSTASGYSSSKMIVSGAGTDATGSGNLILQIGQANGSVTSGEQIGTINFGDTSGYSYANIIAAADLDAGSDSPGRLVFSTTADGASSPTERMRIANNGDIDMNTGDITGNPRVFVRSGSTTPLFVDRFTNDGNVIEIRQANTTEGAISVSGTTVTYGGGHIARWSQLPNDEDPSNILKGTVMSNLDEMCEWGEEDNEQLNKTKVSDVGGDPNVAGVFVSTSFDEAGPLDFFVAMTGDMIIRIAEGVTVQRGDLLMSAGDGTAKPQDDDIVRSKTVAKVTSTHVTCTYDDGSYCVPCVLMAC
jgi:hypothetical protein